MLLLLYSLSGLSDEVTNICFGQRNSFPMMDASCNKTSNIAHVCLFRALAKTCSPLLKKITVYCVTVHMPIISIRMKPLCKTNGKNYQALLNAKIKDVSTIRGNVENRKMKILSLGLYHFPDTFWVTVVWPWLVRKLCDSAYPTNVMTYLFLFFLSVSPYTWMSEWQWPICLEMSHSSLSLTVCLWTTDKLYKPWQWME